MTSSSGGLFERLLAGKAPNQLGTHLRALQRAATVEDRRQRRAGEPAGHLGPALVLTLDFTAVLSSFFLHQHASSFPSLPARLGDGKDAVSWARGFPSHAHTPPNLYEGGLGAQQQQCPSAQESKPKNFRLRHLRDLALYLPGHMQPAGQCDSHWLGRLMAEGCLSQTKGMAWSLDLPQGIVSPGNSQSTLLEAEPPRDSLGNTASSSSMDPAKGAPSQPGPTEGLGLRPKRSWGSSEESTCPLCKRTRSGALERP